MIGELFLLFVWISKRSRVYSITMLQMRRKFAVRGLTHSAAHHLLAAGESIEQRGYARVADIAKALGITRGSVSVAMQSLRSAGYVTQDENRFFLLTDKGRSAISSIRARHEIVEQFLTDILGLSPEQSHRESCRLEYLIEAPTARRLSALLAYWKRNHPQGPLREGVGKACPECDRLDDGICPCCGLECIDDACPLAEEGA